MDIEEGLKQEIREWEQRWNSLFGINPSLTVHVPAFAASTALKSLVDNNSLEELQLLSKVFDKNADTTLLLQRLTQILELVSKINTLEGEIEDLEKTIEELGDEIEDLKYQYDELEDENERLEAELIDLEDKLDNLGVTGTFGGFEKKMKLEVLARLSQKYTSWQLEQIEREYEKQII